MEKFCKEHKPLFLMGWRGVLHLDCLGAGAFEEHGE